MSIRAYKWAVTVLCVGLLVAVWRLCVDRLQADAAWRISGVCDELERSARSATDPEYVALKIQWVQVYYGQNIGRVSDSRLQQVVRRGYELSMTNSFAILHRVATDNGSTNMSPWLTDWLKEHER